MNVTLMHVTDELVQHMHTFIDKQMSVSGYKVTDISNVSHSNKLFQAVRTYKFLQFVNK